MIGNLILKELVVRVCPFYSCTKAIPEVLRMEVKGCSVQTAEKQDSLGNTEFHVLLSLSSLVEEFRFW